MLTESHITSSHLSPLQEAQQTSSRGTQFQLMLKDSSRITPNSAEFTQSHLQIKDQPSMLTKLQHSLSQRPSFEQLFLIEQQKKHLWQLLALKEQNLEKLEAKIKQEQNKNFQQINQLTQRDDLIKKLRERQLKFRERQVKLQNELKKVTEIKNNIVQEFNYIKSLHFRQQQMHQQYQNSSIPSTTKNQPNGLKLPQTLVPQIHTQTLEQQPQKIVKVLQQQIANIKKEKQSLVHHNSQLKTQLDQVLHQLRHIKLEVMENLHLQKPILNRQIESNSAQRWLQNNRPNVIVEKSSKKAYRSNQAQSSHQKISEKPKSNFTNNCQERKSNPRIPSGHNSLKKTNKIVNQSSFNPKTSSSSYKQNHIYMQSNQGKPSDGKKQKDFKIPGRSSLNPNPIDANQNVKNITHFSKQQNFDIKNQKYLRQLSIR